MFVNLVNEQGGMSSEQGGMSLVFLVLFHYPVYSMMTRDRELIMERRRILDSKSQTQDLFACLHLALTFIFILYFMAGIVLFLIARVKIENSKSVGDYFFFLSFFLFLPRKHLHLTS